jgi:predicted TIM-barrel fold metal-dependent hydrolase
MERMSHSKNGQSKRQKLARRKFLEVAAATGGLLAGHRFGHLQAAPRFDVAAGEGGLVIDCHAHLTQQPEEDRRLIEAADKLGIDRLCCSVLTKKRPATVAGFQACNQRMANGMKKHPNRLLGYCYVNPAGGREALEEIRRCVLDHGFIGIKLYNEHLCTDPIVYPIVELAIELRVPILHHAGHAHRPYPNQPNISDGGHLAKLAARYPESRLICAHICGGGDWEWTIKALRHAANVSLDTSGSVTDEGVIEMAAKVLGTDRLLFGCDMSMTAGVGKIRAARLSLKEKRKILGGNMMRLLEMRG